MNNKIFEIDKEFTPKTFDEFNLDNPIILNQKNYFSKLTHSDRKKTVYLQLPKCISKNGVIKSNNKSYIELVFKSSEKNVIEFFENLENFLTNKIYENKDLWFYESNNMSYEDIQDLLTPIMRSYKSGKNFIIKANIKNDKFNLYDENEKKLDQDDYNKEFNIIPVINLNGIKLSSKNFLIEIILVQFMVIYPEDIFENNFLINLNKNTLEKNNSDNISESTNLDIKYQQHNKAELKQKQDNQYICQDINEIENNEEQNEGKKTFKVVQENPEKQITQVIEENTKKNTKRDTERDLLLEKKNNHNLNLLECEEIDIDINEKHDTIELTNHETIYLEIYKKARKKAKDIKKNAIQAFIEAKNIKTKYNLEYNDTSSSDEEYEEII